MNASFKLVNPGEKYVYDEAYEIWVDKSEDVAFMDTVIDEGLDLNVVGIIKAKEETKTPPLSSGIYYQNELTTYLIEEAAKYDIVAQ